MSNAFDTWLKIINKKHRHTHTHQKEFRKQARQARGFFQTASKMQRMSRALRKDKGMLLLVKWIETLVKYMLITV